MDPILEKILEQTFTFSKLKKRLNLLKTYLVNLYFADQTISKDNVYDQEGLNWINTLGQDFLSHFNKDNVYSLFEALEKQSSQLNSLTIYFAIPLPDEELAQVGRWLRSNIDKNLLFDAKINPELIGGCALVYKGIYKDYSLKNKINLNRNDILQNFKRTLK